jgi:hypothetical protein
MGPLTGELAHVFLVAILDAALISWIALRWYRRSVRRLMRQPGTPAAASAPVGSAPDNPRSAPAASLNPLTVAVFQEQDVPVSRRSHHAGIGWRRLSVAYGIGAALHSAVITAFFLDFDTSLPIAAWFTQWWVLGWPIVPSLAVVLVLNRYEVVRLAIGYVTIGGLAIATVTLTGQVLRRSFSDAAHQRLLVRRHPREGRLPSAGAAADLGMAENPRRDAARAVVHAGVRFRIDALSARAD